MGVRLFYWKYFFLFRGTNVFFNNLFDFCNLFIYITFLISASIGDRWGNKNNQFNRKMGQMDWQVVEIRAKWRLRSRDRTVSTAPAAPGFALCCVRGVSWQIVTNLYLYLFIICIIFLPQIAIQLGRVNLDAFLCSIKNWRKFDALKPKWNDVVLVRWCYYE